MKRYTLTHISDHVLIHELHTIVRQDRCTTADMLAHLAEVDARRLYVAAAAHGTKLELLLAARFPQPDLATLVQAVPAAPSHAPVPAPAPGSQACQLAPAPVGMTTTQQVAQRVEASAPRPKLTPLAPQRFALQVTLSQQTHDKLRYAQELLGHAVPSGDMAQVLDRALDALIAKLERQKFAATSRMRPRRGEPKGRHVPADVRRAVWLRDQGRCTFVSEKGHRCESRTRLELDHIEPAARGGAATVANIRLRCRAHNQYAAEKAFGVGFMQRKREDARRRAAEARARKLADAAAKTRASAKTRAMAQARAAGAAKTSAATHAADEARIAAALEELPWLRTLGERHAVASRPE